MTNREPGWDLWRAFDAAMETRTLSGAARRLGLTQPTLGRQIEALEESLGFTLFVRSQKGLAPTEAAIGIAPMSRTMAATADAMLRASKGGNTDERGVVRLTASEVVSAYVLPDMLARFSKRHPDIEIEIHATDLVDDLLTREADIAVRMVEPVQQALVARKLGDVEIRLYAHRDYLERMGDPESLDDFGAHHGIGYDTLHLQLPAIRTAGLDMSNRSFKIRCDSHIVQHALVFAGMGVGGIQTQIADKNPDLVPVLHDQFALVLGCWLVMHEDLRHAGPTRLLYDHLATEFAEYIRQS